MATDNKPKINLKPSTLDECWAVIAILVEEIARLREQLNTNSTNSSLPPSKDLKKKKINKKNASGRKRGAQSGHKGHNRKLLESHQADEIIKCLPVAECVCGGCVENIMLSARKQVLELPQPKFLLYEYQVYSGKCSKCDTKITGSLPKGISNRWFGPRVHVLMSLLRSKYRLSIRQVKQLLHDLYEMPISIGSVSHAEARVSEALKPAHAEVLANIQSNSLPINIDETGYKQNNRTGWAWILANKECSYFHLSPSRGKLVAKQLLGAVIGTKNTMIISDRYPAYNFIPERQHQVCWAHLKRDFQKISERSGRPGKIGKLLLKYYRLLFKFWKADGDKRWWFFNKMRKKRNRWINKMLNHLHIGSKCGHITTERTCANILAQGKSLWNFFEHAGVEPTNNLAERQLRPLVISKKLSFGCDSTRGARFIERIFTVFMTCAQQGKNVMTFLNATIANYFADKPFQRLIAMPLPG